MNTVSKTIAAVGLVVTALTSTASADTYRHIDSLALSIARKSRLIVAETVHYRHTAEYRHMLSDAREMCRLADHMHEVARYRGSLTHLASDVRELDRQFHHLEGIFDRVERNAAYGHGHIHGHTAHVKALLCSIEDDIHHLQDDIASLHRRTKTYTIPIPTPRTPVYPGPNITSRWGGYNVTPHSSGFGRPTRVITLPTPTRQTSYEIHKSRTLDTRHSSHRSRSRTITIGGGSSRITFGL